MMHISADVQRITLNASCTMISDRRTKQLDIFCRITGFTSDFLSFIDVELIRFFHGTIHIYDLHMSSIDVVGRRVMCGIVTCTKCYTSSSRGLSGFLQDPAHGQRR